MKKKIVAVLVSGILTLSCITPVFADAKDDKIAELEAKVKDLEAQIKELKGEDKEKSDSKTDFSYEQDGYTFKFLKYQVVDSESQGKVLYIFYNFTNNSGQTIEAANALISKAFQNGVELTTSFPDSEPIEEYNNTYKSVQDGGSLDVAFMYQLADNSDVSIEITPLAYMDDTPLGEYTFKLES